MPKVWPEWQRQRRKARRPTAKARQPSSATLGFEESTLTRRPVAAIRRLRAINIGETSVPDSKIPDQDPDGKIRARCPKLDETQFTVES